jgi:hypothetical protein
MLWAELVVRDYSGSLTSCSRTYKYISTMVILVGSGTGRLNWQFAVNLPARMMPWRLHRLPPCALLCCAAVSLVARLDLRYVQLLSKSTAYILTFIYGPKKQRGRNLRQRIQLVRLVNPVISNTHRKGYFWMINCIVIKRSNTQFLESRSRDGASHRCKAQPLSAWAAQPDTSSYPLISKTNSSFETLTQPGISAECARA